MYRMLFLVFAAFLGLDASCRSNREQTNRPLCGFADPQFTTAMGVCQFAAEYYVARHKWPLSQSELEEQLTIILEKERANLSAEEFAEIAKFFEPFTLLELKKDRENLKIHYRCIIDGKTFSQRMTLRPAATVQGILEMASE